MSNFIVFYLSFSIVLSTILLLYVWRNHRTRGSKAFFGACLAAIFWMVGDVFGRVSLTFEAKWIGEIIRFTGIIPMSALLFIFSWEYCGKEISRSKTKWLFVIPAISWIMVVTNPYHHLFFRSLAISENNIMLKADFSIYFWMVHLPYSYGLMFLSFTRVLMELSRASRDYRRQLVFLLISLFIPVVFSLVGVFKLITDLQPAPLSFPIVFSIMAYLILRHQFLGGNPIAYETVFHTIRDGVLILDRNDVIRDINPAAAEGLGKMPKAIIGTHVREAFKAWQSATELYDNKPVELGEIEVSLFGSTRFLSIESTPINASNGVYDGRIVTIRDITDKHQHQLSLEALAFHDPLTRLANRRKFQEEVELAIEKANDLNQPFALLYLDLNRFKSVNDLLGHEVGDELLKYVAARIASILRKPDILARLGGDEFALLLNKCDENGVEVVVERMLENVQRPFRVGENTLIADLSIGAAYYPKDGKNLNELLRRADSEMYRAKQNGGGLHLPSIKLDSLANLEM